MCTEVYGTLQGTPVFDENGYVFWHDDGLKYYNFSSNFAAHRRRVNKKRVKAGKPEISMRFYDLRHRFAVDYLRATRSPEMKRGDVYRLSEILGHNSVKTTEIYLRYIPPLNTRKAQMKAQV